MKKLVCSMLILEVVMLLGGNSAHSAGAEKANPDRQVDQGCTRKEIFKKVGDVELNVWIFEPEGHTKKDSRPAIVFFFGGGWTGRSISQFLPHSQYLASRGMVAVIADYRTKKVNDTSPVECVKDGKSAVRWVRDNAKRLGIDPERIAASGGSAGGHVAAATATLPGLEEDGEDLSVSSKPDALVLFNPVFDNGPDGYGFDRVGGEEGYRRMSPIDNIKPGAPPTIVFLGSEDKLIPLSTAERYKTLMEKAGSRCEVHIYEGQGHGFFNASKSDGEYLVKTVNKADGFLRSIGYLKGDPTIETWYSANAE
jgi:acetyl esterase